MEEKHIATQIMQLLVPLAHSLHLDVWGLEVAVGPKSLVRVYVEHPATNSVDIDECAELSRLLGLSLDVAEYIAGSYVLEVSSPGLERRYFTAEQLQKALGEFLDLQLFTASDHYPHRKRFKGQLAECKEGIFTLKLINEEFTPTEEQLTFTFDTIKKATRIHLFPDTRKPSKSTGKKKDPLEKKQQKPHQLKNHLDASTEIKTEQKLVENYLEK